MPIAEVIFFIMRGRQVPLSHLIILGHRQELRITRFLEQGLSTREKDSAGAVVNPLKYGEL